METQTLMDWVVTLFYLPAYLIGWGISIVIWWFILGFLFSFVALIAVVGLPDRKLRKYIRQIGEKQNAIDPEGSNGSKKIVNEKPLTSEKRKEMIKSLSKKKD